MVVFLIGGESRLMDGLINKFNKDGHRVYLLTGNRNVRTSYQKVFEKYNLNMTVTAYERFLRVQIQMLLFLLVHRTRITVGKMPEKKRYNFLQI